MFDSKSKILIVDDMNMFRMMVKQALGTLEYKNVTEAVDGQAAFTALEQALEEKAPFDLVISDWNMPKMKGLDLLKKIRGSAWGKELPFIMLTAEAEKENVIQAMKEGVDMYMIKPFNVDTLRQKLAQTHAKHHKKAG